MITVLYTCNQCGVSDRPVSVPARQNEDIDVRYWVGEVVAGCVSRDHNAISPNCHVKKLTMVKIPCPPESEFIGQQIE